MTTTQTSTTLVPIPEEMVGDVKKLPLELRALFASFSPPSAAVRNRRRSPRRPFIYPVAMHVRTEGDSRNDVTLWVHTRDRNETCISFLADAHVSAGTLVVLDFSGTAETATLGRISCRVRRCRQFREGWFECVVEMGDGQRREVSAWERFVHWLGESSGFGPDCRRKAAQYAARRAAG
jgi:hypothetical protein